jgi:signal transduction histidine kinase
LTSEDQNKLFQSFSQLDNSPTKLVERTGLGLAIAKQISELMGETIGVSSELGKGANLWFTFKAYVSKKKEKETLQENTITTNKGKFDLKGTIS